MIGEKKEDTILLNNIVEVSKEEQGIINSVIQLDDDKRLRTFPLTELKTAMDIWSELEKNVEDNQFINGHIQLNAEHKVFLKKLIDERKWGVLDGKFIFILQEKLK